MITRRGYSNDTKIWHSIRNEEDIVQLQKDINNLHMWSINNKMIWYIKTHLSFCNQ